MYCCAPGFEQLQRLHERSLHRSTAAPSNHQVQQVTRWSNGRVLLLVCLLLYQRGCGRLARCGGHAAEAKGRFAAAGSAGSWGGLNNRTAGRRAWHSRRVDRQVPRPRAVQVMQRGQTQEWGDLTRAL